MVAKLNLFLNCYYYLLLSRVMPLFKKQKHAKSVLYLAAFYPENAGYHWRVEKWAETMRQAGYKVSIKYALNKNEFKTLYGVKHERFLITFLKRRFRQILESRKYEHVIVRRELLVFNDYGNLFLEKMLSRIHPNAVLDYDDDIAAAKEQPKEITNKFARLLLENGNKFNESLSFYGRFIVASKYLKSQLLDLRPELSEEAILIMPTCVDYDQYSAKNYSSGNDKITFGWIGGEHNYHLIRSILPVLEKQNKETGLELVIIGGQAFDYTEDLSVRFIQWTLETEIEDLYQIDIGLMPLSGSEIDKGKSGFKLIQYMGLGIVSIASGITINKEIIKDEQNGFLVEDNNWEDVIRKVISQRQNFQQIGANAKTTIESRYTFHANQSKYVTFIANS